MDFENHVPFQCICPITQSLMTDPVVIVDGHSFERQAIQHWFKNGNTKNPLTNMQLTSFELIPNRNLKSITATFIEKTSRMKIINAQLNWKAYFENTNFEVAQRFPNLVDQFGMIRLKTLQKVFERNEFLEKENKQIKNSLEQLRFQINHERMQVRHHFPEFYSEGIVNFKAIGKLIKKQKQLLHQNQQLQQTMNILKEELSNEKITKSLVIDLMNSQSQIDTVNITESWYDLAANALNQVIVPPKSLFIHITESQQLINQEQLPNNKACRVINYSEQLKEQLRSTKKQIKCKNCGIQSYISLDKECIQFPMKEQMLFYPECISKLKKGVTESLFIGVFARAFQSQTFQVLRELTIKIHHDLFDSPDLLSLVKVLNGIKSLMKVTIIVDPLFTILDKKYLWSYKVGRGT